MRTALAFTAATILLTGCSASVSIGTESPGGPASTAPPATSAPIPSASPDTPEATATQPTLGPGFTLVSSDLGVAGRNGFSTVAGAGDLLAAATYSVTDDDDMDVGLALSQDGGMTWQARGPLDLVDDQYLADVLPTADGLVLVGTTRREKADEMVREALIMVAPAPDFDLQVIPTPEEFTGDVSLTTVFADGSDWVIIGSSYEPAPRKVDGDNASPTVWRSPDEGSTWTRTVIEVAGSSDTIGSGFVLGPDGSWNLFGQSHTDQGDRQFDAAWLRSTDGGASFTLMYPDQLARDTDQGAYSLAFSPSGAMAMSGWDEVVEDGEDISVLWAAPYDSAPQPVGRPEIPVQGGTPPGEFLAGLLWDNETLVAWGSSDGVSPGAEVQFWAFDGSEFAPTTILPGNGELVSLSRVVSNGDLALLFGTSGDEQQRNLAIWAGTLAPQ